MSIGMGESSGPVGSRSAIAYARPGSQIVTTYAGRPANSSAAALMACFAGSEPS